MGSQMSIKSLALLNVFPKYFFLSKSNCQDYVAINSYLQLGHSQCKVSEV